METGNSSGLSPAEGRKFGLTVGLAFLVLAGVGWWRGHDLILYLGGLAGGVLLVAGLLVPARLGPVHRAWMGLAAAISRVTTPIMMSIVYFLVVTPSGLLLRLFGRNPVRREERDGSYWVPREERSQTDLERQF